MAMSRRNDAASASASLSSTQDIHDCFPQPRGWKYDVFLSFQGEGPSGTRNNFTDILYTTLWGKGIATFKDDEEMKKGRAIGDHLMKAIEDSALFLVVFSRDYASSKWCLDELTMIMECSKIRGTPSSSSLLEEFVLPIFHDVEPKDVRTQKGSFEESFLRHEQDDAVEKEKVCKWKSAMTDAGNLSGWVTRGRKWTEIADEIAQFVFNRTNHHLPSVLKNLVGFDSHMKNILTHLSMDSICFLGICGMGGIGKTTLAEMVHRRIHRCFEASIFLHNIRETSSQVGGLISLQKRLILKLFAIKSVSLDIESDGVELIQKRLSQKKVLIILDDVDDSKQLEAFALGHDCFKNGSKVIITTRDERLLNVYGAIQYKLQELNEADALKLFCRKAFHSDSPPRGHAKLSNVFIDRLQGLPLALSVLGSSLYKRSTSEWHSAMSKLAKKPIQEVTSTLQISFDGLDEIEKKVFLDIACFFNGKSERQVLFILSSCYGFSLNHVINRLKERSLLKESLDKNLWMHDLIREMGREVVYQEAPDDPGKRSFLWDSEDIYSVFSEFVKGMILTSPISAFRTLNARAFCKMTKLKLLKLRDVPFHNNLTYLSNELRLMEWQGFPFDFLPTSFEAKYLVELKLPNSHLKELWRGTKYFTHLKTINLSHSTSLLKSPDFTNAPHLEKIILKGCLQLQEVDKSVGILKKLTLLCLEDCKQLKVLPDDICNLQSLKFLNVNGCSSLIAFPRNLHSLTSLEALRADGMMMKPSSTSRLPYLNFSALESSRYLRGLCMPLLFGFTSLKELNLKNCNLDDGAITDDIGRLHSLEKLKLGGNMFTKLPPIFTQLTKLKLLALDRCKNLHYLPTLPSATEAVLVNDCPSLKWLPGQLFSASVAFMNCRKLVGNYGGSDNLAKVLLEKYLVSSIHQAPHHANRCFRFLIPGNSIPRWIRNQGEGDLLGINLPDSGLQGKCSGFVVCCVFTYDRHQDAGKHNIRCTIKTNNQHGCHRCGFQHGRQRWGSWFRKNTFEPGSDNIWLLYSSCKACLSGLFSQKRITFSFVESKHVTIKSCGADLIFEQKAEQTQACQIIQLD